MLFQLRSRPRKPSRAAIVCLAGAAIFFLFECSGLHFPIWNAKGRLDKHLTADLGLSLPPGSKVTHAISIAYRDPGECYALEIPQAAVAPFMAAVRAAGTDSQDLDPAYPWHFWYRVPSWWKPQSLPQPERLNTYHNDKFGGYEWFYSPTSSTVYVFWFRT